MGYTHYWFDLGVHDPSKWESIFPRLSADAVLLIKASGVSIKNHIGEGEPVLTNKVIAINGDKDKDEEFESCVISNRPGGGLCKTGRRPYDVVVTAILIRAAQLLGRNYMDNCGEEIISDGSWADWYDGRELVKKVFPNDEVVCPWGRYYEEDEDEDEDQDQDKDKDEDGNKDEDEDKDKDKDKDEDKE